MSNPIVAALMDARSTRNFVTEGRIFKEFRRLNAIATRVEYLMDSGANQYRVMCLNNRYLVNLSTLMNLIVKERKHIRTAFIKEIYRGVLDLNSWMAEQVQSRWPIADANAQEFLNRLVESEMHHASHLYNYCGHRVGHCIENSVATCEFSGSTQDLEFAA